jgi:hypothetical protein
MAKPISPANTFAGTNPPWNLAQLDENNTDSIGAINDLATYENFFADTGAVNAISVVLTTGLTATLAAGLSVTVLIANTNTAQAVTLNVGGTGAQTVKNQDLSSPQAGQLSAGSVVKFVYDGTYFQIVSGAGSGTAFFNSLAVLSTSGGKSFLATGSAVETFGVTANAYVDISSDKGQFTGTITDISGSPTTTVVWSRQGNQVTVSVPGVAGTSTANTFTMTGWPSVIYPARTQYCAVNPLEDNGTTTYGTIQISSAGVVNFLKQSSTATSTWTASGAKGIAVGITLTYMLN